MRQAVYIAILRICESALDTLVVRGTDDNNLPWSLWASFVDVAEQVREVRRRYENELG